MTTFNHGVHRFVNPQTSARHKWTQKWCLLPLCLIAGIGSIAMGYLLTYLWHWLRQWPERLLCLRGRGAMGISSADRDGRDILGRSWAILLTLFRIRYWMISNIPLSLRIGITSGIGLFIALMGLKNTAVIVATKTPRDDWRFKLTACC